MKKIYKHTDAENALFAVGVAGMRDKYRADALEGEEKNENARRLGTFVATKWRCGHCVLFQVRTGAYANADCAYCGGAGWSWSDGVRAKVCPASLHGLYCARPWCWACKNGLRPQAEIDAMLKYQRELKVGA